ncbi:hypothetical protein UFOVP14_2 [uncultured Caudovirales phage]|uniref:Uncharacterized protein n=1 Tax=uncultured Caudovirales phage TaxID=2100421 RepID=A0A6J5KIY6_9CAUD|nr:hypothetical protein UFOVP14_2 [uncultured Caudovirales phage]
MSNKFYRIKEICIDLGISHQTLYTNVDMGKLPPLEHPNPINSRISGYKEATFRQILQDLAKRLNQ